MPPRDARFPVVLHYGLTFNVLDYAFSKHWYHGFTSGVPTKSSSNGLQIRARERAACYVVAMRSPCTARGGCTTPREGTP